jgi:NAD(P)-dependent dehydrogenase (short-subunit alcohol dehydrogenase family)
LERRTVLVTGAASGIGLETARGLSAKGARVLVGARDETRGSAVVDELSRGAGAELFPIDLSSFASVRHAAERLLASERALDVLVNNAGTVSRTRRVTADGHELTWQTNFLGGFLLTRLLLPALKSARGPRVVNVSSAAHYGGRIAWEDLELTRGYATLKAYAQSKLAQVLFTRELARREPGVAVNAVHPGAIATKIWDAAPLPLAALVKAVLPSPAKGARGRPPRGRPRAGGRHRPLLRRRARGHARGRGAERRGRRPALGRRGEGYRARLNGDRGRERHVENLGSCAASPVRTLSRRS